MIERYTIKFGSAVSQKELERALHEPGLDNDSAISRVHKMNARIEGFGDFEDLQKIAAVLKELAKK